MMLETLSPGTYAEGVPATLTDAAGKVVLHFQFNPETIDYDYESKHAEVPVGATVKQPQHWVRTTGRTIVLPNLLVDTHAERLSAENLLAAVQALTLPAPYEPVDVYFTWGVRTLGPCRLITVKVSENYWLSGAFAGGTMTLTMVEVYTPPVQGPVDTRPVSKNAVVRTPRQKEALLASTRTKLLERITDVTSDVVRQALRDNTFALTTDDYGKVLLEVAGAQYSVNPDTGGIT